MIFACEEFNKLYPFRFLFLNVRKKYFNHDLNEHKRNILEKSYQFLFFFKTFKSLHRCVCVCVFLVLFVLCVQTVLLCSKSHEKSTCMSQYIEAKPHTYTQERRKRYHNTGTHKTRAIAHMQLCMSRRRMPRIWCRDAKRGQKMKSWQGQCETIDI